MAPRQLVLLLLVGLASGCTQRTEAPVPVPPKVSAEPRQVELSDARAKRIEPELVEFEVRYRFTQGEPCQAYACDITFPGTSNHGVRKMENWELKHEGVIRDRVTLSSPGAKTFSITLSEAPSRRESYKKISNVVSGPID